MIGWAIAAVYVLGYVYSGRKFTLRIQENDIRRYMGLYSWRRMSLMDRVGSEELEDEAIAKARDNLAMNALAGFVTAVVWPICLPPFMAYLALQGNGGSFFTTQLEKDVSQKRELKKLRAFAQANGLPMGDE